MTVCIKERDEAVIGFWICRQRNGENSIGEDQTGGSGDFLVGQIDREEEGGDGRIGEVENVN